MEWGWSDEFPGLAGVYEDTSNPNPRLLATYTGRGKSSGVEIEQQGAHVWRLRDGKVVRLEVFAERHKALDWVHRARREEVSSPQPRHRDPA